MNENTHVPSDLEAAPKKVKKPNPLSGKSPKFWVGSTLAVLVVGAAIFAGIYGGTDLFQGNLIKDYKQLGGTIKINPILNHYFVEPKSEDTRANQLIFALEYGDLSEIYKGEIKPGTTNSKEDKCAALNMVYDEKSGKCVAPEKTTTTTSKEDECAEVNKVYDTKSGICVDPKKTTTTTSKEDECIEKGMVYDEKYGCITAKELNVIIAKLKLKCEAAGGIYNEKSGDCEKPSNNSLENKCAEEGMVFDENYGCIKAKELNAIIARAKSKCEAAGMSYNEKSGDCVDATTDDEADSILQKKLEAEMAARAARATSEEDNSPQAKCEEEGKVYNEKSGICVDATTDDEADSILQEKLEAEMAARAARSARATTDDEADSILQEKLEAEMAARAARSARATTDDDIDNSSLESDNDSKAKDEESNSSNQFISKKVPKDFFTVNNALSSQFKGALQFSKSTSSIASSLATDAKSVICIHDLDVEAGIPPAEGEDKLHECFEIPTDYDGTKQLISVNAHDFADRLNGKYKATVIIASAADRSFVRGSTEFAAKPTFLPQADLSVKNDTLEIGSNAQFSFTASEGVYNLNADLLQELTTKSYFTIKNLATDETLNKLEVAVVDSEFGVRTVPIKDSQFDAGTYEFILNTEFRLKKSRTLAGDKINYRFASDPVKVTIVDAKDPADEKFCSAFSVSVLESFPSNAVVGTEIYQSYVITNDSGGNGIVGLVLPEDNPEGFAFYNKPRTDVITSVEVGARNSGETSLIFTPTTAGSHSAAISFVPMYADAHGQQCEPIFLKAAVKVVGGSGNDEEKLSCDLDVKFTGTDSSTFNPETEVADFLVDASSSLDRQQANLTIEIFKGANVVKEMSKNNVDLDVRNYNPSDGTFDWEGYDDEDNLLPDGTYTAQLTVFNTKTKEKCTDKTKLTIDADEPVEEEREEEDDENIFDEEEDDDYDFFTEYDSYYGNNTYVPPTPDPEPVVTTTVNRGTAPSSPTEQTPDLGFHASATAISGDTGPGMLVYPLMMMGSAMIARRRRK